MADPKDEYSPGQAITNLLDVGKRFLTGGVPGAVSARMQQSNTPSVTGVIQNAAGKIAQGGRNAAAVGSAFMTGGVPGAFSQAAQRMGGKSLVSEANAAAPEYANPNPNGGGVIRPAAAAPSPVATKPAPAPKPTGSTGLLYGGMPSPTSGPSPTVALDGSAGGMMPGAVVAKDSEVMNRMLAPRAQQAVRRPTVSGAARPRPVAAAAPAPATIAAPQAGPVADYWDGRQAYINRIAANDPGLRELQRTNRSINEIEAYKSKLAAGYEESPEYQEMLALGDQAGTRNNPNDPTSWTPVQVTKVGYDPRTGESTGVDSQTNRFDAKSGMMMGEEDAAQRDAYDSVMDKNVGDEMTQREAGLISKLPALLQQQSMSNKSDEKRTGMTVQGGIDQQKISTGGAITAANIAHGESNKLKALERDAVVALNAAIQSGDQAAIAAAMQRVAAVRSGGNSGSEYAPINVYDDMGNIIGQRLYNKKSGAVQNELGGAAQKFENGKVYTDANGNRAKYMDGKWQEIK